MPQIAELRGVDGATWARIPISGDEGRIQILSDAEITANDQKMARLLDENEQLRSALAACESWIDRWTKHVGSCEGGDKCTCGRSAVLYEAQKALNPEQTFDKSER